MKREIGLEEYKSVILNVLLKVDEICKEHNLRYSLFYGTLLGAVRHQGYIPWDDDIDIAMPIEDYDRLASIIQKGNYGLYFIRPEESKDTCFAFGKICDTRTTIHESSVDDIKGYGAYIDVYPFVKIPVNGKWDNYKKWKTYRRLASYSKLKKYKRTNSGIQNLGRFIEFSIGKVINPRKLALKSAMAQREANQFVVDNNVDYNYGVIWHPKRFPKDMFDNQQVVMFEGHELCGTSDYDTVLKIEFGDYMKLPPEEKRIPHHYIQCIIDD